jgi:hypothetical protein
MVRRLFTVLSVVLPLATCVPLARGQPSSHLVVWPGTSHVYVVGNGRHGTLMLVRSLSSRADPGLAYIEDMGALVEVGQIGAMDPILMDRGGFALYADRIPLNEFFGKRTPLDNCGVSVPAWAVCQVLATVLHMPVSPAIFPPDR